MFLELKLLWLVYLLSGYTFSFHQLFQEVLFLTVQSLWVNQPLLLSTSRIWERFSVFFTKTILGSEEYLGEIQLRVFTFFWKQDLIGVMLVLHSITNFSLKVEKHCFCPQRHSYSAWLSVLGDVNLTFKVLT